MTEDIDPAKIVQQSLEWLSHNVLSMDSIVQFIIVMTGFLLGMIAERIISPRLKPKILALKIPYRFRQILLNITKLVTPVVAIIVIFVGISIAGSDIFKMHMGFATAVYKLLMAWVFIRLVVQFIRNNAVRNSAALLVWIIAALSIFGVLDETKKILDSIGIDMGDSRISALSVTKGGLAIFALLYMASFVANIVERRISKASSLTPSSRVLISKIARIVLMVAALLIGITSAGIDLSLLAVFSGAVGLGIGFGLQKVISNLFSGMLLLIDQSIKPGDVIELDGTFGWVNHMGARYTEIVTRDNKSYLVPNENFVTQEVVNWSHGNTLVRVETKFGVHYDSDPRLVKKLAEEAAAKPERVVDDPPPVCHLVEFGESSINFVLRFWIKDAEKGVTNMRGAVMLNLWDALHENKIKIPYPQREILLRKEK